MIDYQVINVNIVIKVWSVTVVTSKPGFQIIVSHRIHDGKLVRFRDMM